MLAGAEAAGGQHLSDASVETFDHPVGLWMGGLDEKMLDAVRGIDPVESVLPVGSRSMAAQKRSANSLSLPG